MNYDEAMEALNWIYENLPRMHVQPTDNNTTILHLSYGRLREVYNFLTKKKGQETARRDDAADSGEPAAAMESEKDGEEE